MDGTIAVKFSYRGSSATVPDLPRSISTSSLLATARSSLGVDDGVALRLIHKGKTVARDREGGDGGGCGCGGKGDDRPAALPAFPEGTKFPKGAAKIVVVGTDSADVRDLNSRRSDPLMRGFDDEKAREEAKGRTTSSLSSYWGPRHGRQHPKYKFCRFQECTDASFGSRPGAATPHAFRARELLERLATDPGVVSILTSRELVVGTLGEMDPIDDRLMQKKAQEGACLLGYNTNHGLRIDVKLRADDLSAFRPYKELAATLIHELSHNWCSEHDVLFWTNYGQMRAEYLWRHARLTKGGAFAGGKRTAALAGVTDMIAPEGENVRGGSVPSDARTMERICASVTAELAREMAQHRLPVQLVAPAVVAFARELMAEAKDGADADEGGRRLGSGATGGNDAGAGEGTTSARERALAAAERRAREAKDDQR